METHVMPTDAMPATDATPAKTGPTGEQRRPALLELDNVHAYYGAIHALQGISLSVDEGEIVTLIGANGAGKSTTLNAISGLVRAREGTIRLAGEEIGATPPHEVVTRGIVQVPEGRRIFARLTIDENLRMGGYTVSSPGEIRDGIDRAYEMFPRLKERRA